MKRYIDFAADAYGPTQFCESCECYIPTSNTIHTCYDAAAERQKVTGPNPVGEPTDAKASPKEESKHMDKEAFLQLFEDTVSQMRDTLIKKGNDYTSGAGSDRLSNFRIIEHLGIASAEAGLLCRVVDKISRINAFIKSGKLSVNESADDAVMDIIGYCILLRALMKTRK